MKKTLALLGSSAALASVLSLGGALTAATPAQADPVNCDIGAYGREGNSSFTVHWDTNYCQHPVRSWVNCTAEDFSFGWEWTATGSSSTSVSDSSDAQCGPGIVLSFEYGYDTYINGTWHRYNMHDNVWTS
jgi:hypothetical protein